MRKEQRREQKRLDREAREQREEARLEWEEEQERKYKAEKARKAEERKRRRKYDPDDYDDYEDEEYDYDSDWDRISDASAFVDQRQSRKKDAVYPDPSGRKVYREVESYNANEPSYLNDNENRTGSYGFPNQNTSSRGTAYGSSAENAENTDIVRQNENAEQVIDLSDVRLELSKEISEMYRETHPNESGTGH